ncbi:MAG: dihydroorotate dehydrogenase electron transfer subunit [Eubacteriales bacterium]|nr:dihydroorotate dehydrogenase electron transfer subunit [Eubacteriales bacterium]MDD4421582.1 dihydroorotate dehydrogenase electron transfer subunit [Eubacteriales bacterium]
MSEKYTVISNNVIAENIYRMVLQGNTEKITKPGQFISIGLDGFFLRRPFSVCDLSADKTTIIYKILGGGTKSMSSYKKGKELDVLSGLGNGFSIEKSGEKPVLIGGGVGVPPLYLLAKRLIEAGKKPSVIIGFNKSAEVFLREEFEALGCRTLVSTIDGSAGIKGVVTDALYQYDYDYVFTCGPMPMLKAVYDNTETGGQFSFEERMACGIGACMGCTCKTKYGYKRICRDGPVLEREEIIW